MSANTIANFVPTTVLHPDIFGNEGECALEVVGVDLDLDGEDVVEAG